MTIWEKLTCRFEPHFPTHLIYKHKMSFYWSSANLELICQKNESKTKNRLISAFGQYGANFPEKSIKYINIPSIGLRPIWGSFPKKINKIYE